MRTNKHEKWIEERRKKEGVRRKKGKNCGENVAQPFMAESKEVEKLDTNIIIFKTIKL